MNRRRLRVLLVVLSIGLITAAGALVNVYLALRPETLEAHLREGLAGVLRGPFAFTSFVLSWDRGAEIRNLRVYPLAAQGATPEALEGTELLQVPSLRVVPRLGSLIRGRFEIKQIEITSPILRVARKSGGRWSFEGILSETPTSPPGAADFSEFPAIIVEDGKLLYSDEGPDGVPVAQSLDEVYAHVHRSGEGLVKLKAQVRTAFARKLEVQGSLEDGKSGPVLRMDVVGSRINLAAPFAAFLPPAAAEEVKKLGLEGFVDVVGRFKWDAKDGIVPISVSADVLRAELNLPHSPHPLRGLKGKAILTERSFVVDKLEGSLGGARVVLSGKADFTGPWLVSPEAFRIGALSLDVRVDSFLLDQRVRDALPPELRAIFEEYKVDGPIGLGVVLKDCRSFPPRPEDVSASVRFDGVEFVYKKFAYPVTDLRGEVLIEKGRVTIERPIVGKNGPIVATVAGRGAALTPYGDIEIVIKAENVPLDEKFRAALPKEVHAIWDDFQLVGAGNGTITIARDALVGVTPGPDGSLPKPVAPHVTVDALPVNVRMSYRHFSYEINSIQGKVHLDIRRDLLTFDGLVGKHGGHVIQGSGAVDMGDHRDKGRSGALFKIELESKELVVDDDLVNALSEDSRRLLEDFKFKGRVNANVSIHSTERSAAEVTADVNLIEASVNYRLFTYPLTLQKGRLRILADGALAFEGLSTADDAQPRVVFSGQLTQGQGLRTLGFDFDLGSLRFDEKLMEALPPYLQSFVTNMKLGGTFKGRVAGSYTFDNAHPERFKIIYSGKDVSSEDASVDFGLRIHNMVAKGNFVGSKDADQPHQLVGEVSVESAWFNRIHLTKGDIDFSLGASHTALELLRKGGRIPGRDYMPPPWMAKTLTPEKARDAFQMLVHSGDLYGGKVDGFIFVETAGQRDMGADFVGSGFELARAAEDVFGAKGTGTSGTAKGKFSFTGKQGNFMEIKGSGEGLIEKAKLVELPLFLGILSLIFGEGSGRHYFNEVLLKYDIKDGQFVAPKDGIDIRSPGVKLEGGGTMDFGGNLDLTLEPSIFDTKIPIVEQVFSLIKKGLAQVRITGDLTKPKVDFATAGGILKIGIDPGKSSGTPPLPTDIRRGEPEKDLPPGTKKH